MHPIHVDNISKAIEVDILNAETESPDMHLIPVTNHTNFTTRVYKPSSVATVTLFIIVGLLAFMFTVMFKGKKKNKLMQCVVNVKSCYINYGSTNIHLPQFMPPLTNIPENYSFNSYILKKCKKGIKYDRSMLNERQYFHVSKKQITMVSDLWKAKSQQSNNFFIINIIPEEDEHQAGNL